MNVLLKRFSQEVDLENTNEVCYFLVFDCGGKELRLPVPKETTEALAQAIYGNDNSPPAPETPPEDGAQKQQDDDLTGASFFGGDGGDGEDVPHFTEDPYEGPSSEDEVPPL